MSVMINRAKLKKMLNKMEEEPFLPNIERGGVEEEVITAKWLFLKTMLSCAFYASVIIFLGSAISYTFIKQMTSDNPNDWLFPFGQLTVLNATNRLNYEISWFYQNVSVVSIGMKLSGIMNIMCGTLSYTCTQLQILQHYLQSIAKNCHQRPLKSESVDIGSFSNNIKTNGLVSWKYLQPTIKQAVSYHQKILEFIAEVEEIFTLVILILYIAAFSSLCVLMYAISLVPLQEPHTQILLIAAGLMAGFPLPVCYWGEQISHYSEQVAMAAYEAYSVESDLRFQKSLLIIMKRSQRTVLIKAGKFVDTSMITYGWILRTAYTYFMVLRRTNMDTQ